MRTLEETITALETEIDALAEQMRLKNAALEMARHAPSQDALTELVREVLNGRHPSLLTEALLAEAAPTPLPPVPVQVPASMRAAVAAAATQAIAREDEHGTLDEDAPESDPVEAGQASPEPAGEPASAGSRVEAAAPSRRDVEADQAILFLLGSGPKSMPELAKRLKHRGEEPKKAVDRTRVRVSRLVDEGRVVRVERGIYGLPQPAPSRPALSYPETACEVVWNGSMKRPLCSNAGGLGSALGGLVP